MLCVALACGGGGEGPTAAAAAGAPRIFALEIADTRGCVIEGSSGFNRVYCWSGGGAGRVARRVPALEPAVAISVSDRSICSVRAGIQVRCLDDLDAPERVRAIDVGMGLFTALARDDCALRIDGRVGCRRRRDVEALEGVIDIGGDVLRECYLQQSGTLSCVVNGRLKPSGSFPGAVAYRAGCVLYGDGTVSCPAGRMGYAGALRRALAPVELPGPAIAIAASASHGCALVESGELVCQGSNAWGQLGDGRTGGGPELTRVALEAPYSTRIRLGGMQKVAVSRSESCAAGSGGVFCWGTPMVEAERPPTEHAFTLAARSLVADRRTTCANVGEQTLCWGVRNPHLESDPSGIRDAATPRPVTLPHVGLRAVTELGYLFEGGALVPGYLQREGANVTTAAGGTIFHAQRGPAAMSVREAAGYCVLGEDGGELRCLSEESLASTALLTGARTFVPVLTGGSITAITATGLRACIVDAAGEVTCAALRGKTAWRRPGAPIRGVFSNARHDCAITMDGGVECWRPVIDDRRRGYHLEDPAFVLPLQRVIEAVADEDEVCARTLDGAIDCVHLSDHTGPAQRWIASGARQLVAGSYHFCALVDGDLVRCRGDDRFGQLGGRPRHVTTEPTPIPLEG